MNDKNSDRVLDGNAAASLLKEIFVPEITMARIQCIACGSTVALGSLRLYAAPMGAVLRCTQCDCVVIRSAQTPRGRWVDMTGARYLKF
jgi:hypothetical protein